MVIWIILLLYICIVKYMLGDLKTKRKKILFLIFSGVGIIFVMGSRNAEINYGTDLNNYYRLYGRAIDLSWNEFVQTSTMEIGYLGINKFFAMFIPWQQFIVYFHATFTTIIILRFIYKNTQELFLGVLFYICLGTMQFFLTGFRQSIAISLCLIAFEFARERKLLKYLIIILIAFTIHKTAILFLPIYIIVHYKSDIINNFICTSILMISFLFTDNLIQFGNEVFEKGYEGTYQGNTLGGLVPIIIYIITILIFIYMSSNKLKKERLVKESGLINMMVLGLGIYLMRYQALIFERVSFYFTPAMIPLLANNLYFQEKINNKKILYYFFLSISIALLLWRVSTSYGTYIFFWQSIT